MATDKKNNQQIQISLSLCRGKNPEFVNLNMKEKLHIKTDEWVEELWTDRQRRRQEDINGGETETSRATPRRWSSGGEADSLTDSERRTGRQTAAKVDRFAYSETALPRQRTTDHSFADRRVQFSQSLLSPGDN